MCTIIAGEFETLEQADGAMEALRTAGVNKDDYGRWSDGAWEDFDPVRRTKPLFPAASSMA